MLWYEHEEAKVEQLLRSCYQRKWIQWRQWCEWRSLELKRQSLEQPLHGHQ